LAEGFPLVEELAQPIWMRSSQASTPLLAVFHEETDSTTQDILHKVAKSNKGSAFFSWSTRLQLLEQWGGTGKVVPSAIMILWVNGEPKFKIWNEETGATFDEANLNAFVKDTLAGTYVAFKKSEAIPEDNTGPVITLVGKNFEEIVYNKEGNPVFVEFYAPWCGHCKKLAPTWEKLASIYKNEENIVIANVDADKHKDVGGRFGVSGFPTIKFFPKDNKAGVAYEGGRELPDFVKYINEKTGAKRTATGKLEESAGRISQLDSLVSGFLSSTTKEDALKKAEGVIKSLTGEAAKHGEHYLNYMKAIIKKGKDVVETEAARLGKMLDGGNLTPNKVDEFTVRKNILSQFK
jgi:protein disulfide isomerase